MTWSIVARDAATGAFGVAVASKVLAVGALCPWARAGVGALSTQSYTNPLYGPDVLAALESGAAIDKAIAAVVAADAGQAWRQTHGVDAAGRAFAHTGADCVGWAGHITGDGVSVAGNMLAGADVAHAAYRAWRDGGASPFARRLLDALEAGEAAGGDKRGRQSAAIRVVTDQPWPWIDLRVDDDAAPIQRLSAMLDDFTKNRAPYYAALARRDDPAGAFRPGDREARVRGYLKSRGLEG